MCETWVRKIPWRRAWQSTVVFLPEEFPWTGKPGRLQFMGLQRFRHNWVTKHSTATSLLNQQQLFWCKRRKRESQVFDSNTSHPAYYRHGELLSWNCTPFYLPLFLWVEKGRGWLSPPFSTLMINMRLSNSAFTLSPVRIQVLKSVLTFVHLVMILVSPITFRRALGLTT